MVRTIRTYGQLWFQYLPPQNGEVSTETCRHRIARCSIAQAESLLYHHPKIHLPYFF